jgi:uncharacterized iron-regulated membrane protein
MPDWLRIVLIGAGLWTGVSIVSGLLYVWAAMRLKGREE